MIDSTWAALHEILADGHADAQRRRGRHGLGIGLAANSVRAEVSTVHRTPIIRAQ